MNYTDEKPLLTVTVITYNQEHYVESAINGVLAQQTNFPVEILISDDASSDGTYEILKQYEKKYPNRLSVVYRKTNVGATRNSYENYISARGKYIASLEGDDYWLAPEYLNEGALFLETNPEYIGIAYRSKIVDEEGCEQDTSLIESQKRFWEFNKEEYTKEDFLDWKMPGQMSAIIFKNIFKDMPVEEMELLPGLDRMVGDRTIMMFLTSRGKIKCDNQMMTAYRYAIHCSDTSYMSDLMGTNHRLEEYTYMSRIEKAAHSTYKGKWSLTEVKKNKLAGAVSILYKERCMKNLKVVWEILKISDRYFSDLLFVIQVWMFRAYCKYIIKEERRFPLREKDCR
ncbi:MAG: glycosyltransferase [Lachnospiraceae bacterium]|nr:glycosyltransferase [Lachnospiraceae bacterium]